MLKLILAVLAIVCFCLDAFHVAASVSWTPLGFAFVTAAVLLPL
jgi:hypothetical protein